MKRHLIFINMVWASMLLLGSCTSESGTGTPDVNPVVSTTGGQTLASQPVPTTQDEIAFQVSYEETQSATTRLTTFDGLADLLPSTIHINAYYKNTTTKYLNDVKLKYYEHDDKWVFWSGSDDVGDWAHYYWPIPNSYDVTNSVPVDAYGTLDFVGYVPYTLPTSENDNDYKISYSYTAGKPAFACTLPYTTGSPNTFNATNQATLQEYMYAYSGNRTKNTTNISLATGVVPLEFKHIFAQVNIYLKQARRGTVIKGITLKDLYIKGVYTHANTPEWGSYDATKADLSFVINGGTGYKVPDEINFNTILGGPFLVVPQEVNGSDSNKNLSVVVRNSGSSDDSTIQGYIAAINPNPWKPGYIYNYYLDLGADSNQILVNVEVQPWVTHPKIPIDVK